jgi:hypothetical protein
LEDGGREDREERLWVATVLENGKQGRKEGRRREGGRTEERAEGERRGQKGRTEERVQGGRTEERAEGGRREGGRREGKGEDRRGRREGGRREEGRERDYLQNDGYKVKKPLLDGHVGGPQGPIDPREEGPQIFFRGLLANTPGLGLGGGDLDNEAEEPEAEGGVGLLEDVFIGCGDVV